MINYYATHTATGGISINNPNAWTAFQGGSLDDEYDVL